jgi:aconitate hydratase
VAGPFQPHQRRSLAQARNSFFDQVPIGHVQEKGAADSQSTQAGTATESATEAAAGAAAGAVTEATVGVAAEPGASADAAADGPREGAVVIAAITSCTNTANPDVMIQAGLLARKARGLGLHPKPWVKTSLSPGSQVVADYLRASGLLDDLAALGFDLTGFGCMTCIGNSGRLEPHMESLADRGFKGVAVLSGNRNFAGRVNPKVPAGYLASPALVVAYALAGTIDIDIGAEPVARDAAGRDVFLRDLMPSDAEVRELAARCVRTEDFQARARSAWDGTPHWARLEAPHGTLYGWEPRSTYLRRPGYLESVPAQAPARGAIRGARVLMQLGDNVTTDHISPAGAIPAASLAGQWLLQRDEREEDLNQYSTRRSNHEVMLRGAYTNVAVRNLIEGVPQAGSGGHAWNAEHTEVLPVYEASRSYLERGTDLVIMGGINYGAGSSRDWAAKAQALLGVKAVIALSFERIHRSNLIGMGIYPLEFPAGFDYGALRLRGDEELDFDGLEHIEVGANAVTLRIRDAQGRGTELGLTLRVDSTQEILYLRHGGVLPFVVRKMVGAGERSGQGAGR